MGARDDSCLCVRARKIRDEVIMGKHERKARQATGQTGPRARQAKGQSRKYMTKEY